MCSHLPAQYIAALSPRSILQPDRLTETILKLIISFKRDSDISLPPLNSSLLTFKHVKNLALPLEIYPTAFRLAEVLKLGEFRWPDLLKSGLRADEYPELRLMGLIVISTKLLQPFDDIVRKPKHARDPSAMRLQWQSWKEVMGEKPVKGLKAGDEVSVTEEDVFDMGGEKLDDYLAWYQSVWMDDKEDLLPKQILDLFPVEPIPEKQLEQEEPVSEKIKFVQGHLQVVDPISKEQAPYAAREVVRPGTGYRRCKEISRLNGMEKFFMERAAEQAGCRLEMLVKAVYMLETKIQTLVAKIDIMKRERGKWENRRKQRQTTGRNPRKAIVVLDDDTVMDEDDEL